MFGTKEKIVEVKVVDETKVKELEEKIRTMRADFESSQRIKDNELAMRIEQAISVKEKENNNILQENAVLKKEVEILTKAFENMGFDVKDMKDILDKLVDGIVSKNEINIIK